jgi:two-component system, OmpR family, response regulator ResD
MAHILIVDDDPDIVDSVRVVLERVGHTVASAGDRAEGMRLAQTGGVDLLILDIMMSEPDDGIVMAQELRRGGFARPILMMSSIAKVTGLAYGRDDAVVPADDFVEKPVKPGALIEKVAALLDASGGED